MTSISQLLLRIAIPASFVLVAASCSYHVPDTPRWPSIRNPDVLVADITKEMASRSSISGTHRWPKATWPESVKRLRPMDVMFVGSNCSVIAVGIIPMDSAYGFLVFPVKPEASYIADFGKITATADPRIWRFEQR